jgi:Ethylbenzene dehydrogenase
MSMYITDVKNGGCADTCHLGVGPYAARGEKHGLHYTRGEIGDLWHWKAVRSNPMGAGTGEPGFIDDQHFRGPDPIPLDYLYKRYTAGYYALGFVYKKDLSPSIQEFITYLKTAPAQEIMRKTGHVPVAG